MPRPRQWPPSAPARRAAPAEPTDPHNRKTRPPARVTPALAEQVRGGPTDPQHGGRLLDRQKVRQSPKVFGGAAPGTTESTPEGSGTVSDFSELVITKNRAAVIPGPTDRSLHSAAAADPGPARGIARPEDAKEPPPQPNSARPDRAWPEVKIRWQPAAATSDQSADSPQAVTKPPTGTWRFATSPTTPSRRRPKLRHG